MDFPVEARDELFAREELLIGKKGLDVLAGSCVAVFGLGGVGGNCAEALARAGVGRLILVDNDSFCLSNMNRQLFATADTIGMRKTAAAAERIAKVNPFCEVTALDIFFGEDTADLVDWDSVDFICDAVDTVSAKVLLAAGKRHRYNKFHGHGQQVRAVRFPSGRRIQDVLLPSRARYAQAAQGARRQKAERCLFAGGARENRQQDPGKHLVRASRVRFDYGRLRGQFDFKSTRVRSAKAYSQKIRHARERPLFKKEQTYEPDLPETPFQPYVARL